MAQPRNAKPSWTLRPTSRIGKKILERATSTSLRGQYSCGFSYILKPNDRIGIIGTNGAGKTTMLEIIKGLIARTRDGEVGRTIASATTIRRTGA